MSHNIDCILDAADLKTLILTSNRENRKRD